MRATLWPWVLMAAFLTTGVAEAHQRSWPGKRLAEALPEAKKFTQKQVALTPSQIEWIEKNLGESIRTEDKSPTFYVGTGGNGRSIGIVFFLDATGANGKIEMGVAMSPQGNVLRVVLYEHSESSAVTSKDFLSQFKGKKAADKFQVGDDVTAPRGNEKVAQAIATATRRALLIAMAGLRLGAR